MRVFTLAEYSENLNQNKILVDSAECEQIIVGESISARRRPERTNSTVLYNDI